MGSPSADYKYGPGKRRRWLNAPIILHCARPAMTVDETLDTDIMRYIYHVCLW